MKSMPHWISRVVFLVLFLGFAEASIGQVFPNLGGQRAGISALAFLKNNLSPRSMGMGGADVTLSGDAYSVNTNVALASEVRELTVGLSNLAYSTGLNHTAINFYLPSGENTTWIVTMNNLSSGPMEKRTEFQPNGTGEYYYTSQLAAGIGYSRSISKMFSYGLYTKFIREQIAEYSSNSLAADVGFLYRTDYHGLRFGASLQHFGSNSSLSGSGKPVSFNNNGVQTDDFAAPTLFKMGISINAYEAPDYKIIASLQLNHPNDNSENVRIGAELNYIDRFYIRAGYKVNVSGETWPTAGIGFNFSAFHLPISIDGGMYNNDLLGYYKSVGISVGLSQKKTQVASDVIHD